jgi:ABC-type Mn2+/Zn2+ transport system permease subunit
MILDYSCRVSTLASLPAPTDLLELPYMRTALVEVLLVAVAGGVLGAWIVLRRLAFFAHGAGTAAFPGLVIADATGFSATVAGLAAALAYAIGVERIGRSRRDAGDVATALVLVFALAVGIVLASDVFESGSAVDRLLFGTALGLGGEDLWVAAGVAVLTLLASLLLGRTWTATAFDPGSTTTLGLPVRVADPLLLGLVALAAVAALPAVGALLVTSLFVVPAATARIVTNTVPRLLVVAAAVACAQGALGLYVSLWLDVPPGPAVAIVGSALYVSAILISALRLSQVVRSPALEGT